MNIPLSPENWMSTYRVMFAAQLALLVLAQSFAASSESAPSTDSLNVSRPKDIGKRELALWNAHRFVAIEALPVANGRLPLEHDGKPDWSMTVGCEAALHRTVVGFINSLQAETFEEYCRAIRSGDPSTLQLVDPKMPGRRLFDRKHITDLSKYTGEELLELYWVTETDSGQGKRYLHFIAPDSMRYQLIADPGPILDPKNPAPGYKLWRGEHEDIGVRAASSIFRRPTPEKAPADRAKGSAYYKTVLVRMILKTKPLEGQGNPYPIVARFVWSDSRAVWVPIDVAEMSTIKRRFFPIF